MWRQCDVIFWNFSSNSETPVYMDTRTDWFPPLAQADTPLVDGMSGRG